MILPIRHGRACSGHPRFDRRCENGGDAPGHDGEKEQPSPTDVVSNLSTDTNVAYGTKRRGPAALF
jgi:hypothetical protein